jgi:stress-induced morphogen
MRRPIVGIALAIIALAVAACGNNNTGPRGGTGGQSGGTTGAGGSSASSGTTSGPTGGTIGTSSATGGSSTAGGSAATSGEFPSGGTTSSATGGTAGGSSASGGSSGSDATAGTTSTNSATSGSSGGTIGTAGSTTNDSRPDAGADATADGAGGLPDVARDGAANQDVSSDTSIRFDATSDRVPDAIASNCTCLGKPAPTCTPTGHLSYTLSQATSPTADQADAYKTITCAMDMAVAYYNCYSNITGSVRVTYDTSVATADGNINGSIRFGAGRQYMTCATSMHEIAHTQGIGTASQWASHVSGGLFIGTNSAAQLQAINATLATPLYTQLHADSMHFWPYGLNYDTEATGIDILIDHCEMVVAIRKDLGL